MSPVTTVPDGIGPAPGTVGAAIRLICVPHAGGSASGFAPWGRLLDPRFIVHAVQLPGRETRFREPPATEIRTLITGLYNELGAAMSQPYALFGHSLGAIVAFELAREARRGGRRAPEHLFVSGRVPPDVAVDPAAVPGGSDAELLAWLAHIGGTPEEVMSDPSLRDYLLRLLRADLAVHESYEYVAETPLDTPITAFAGSDDPIAPTPWLTGWSGCTTGRFAVHEIPGDHFFPSSAAPRLLGVVMRALS